MSTNEKILNEALKAFRLRFKSSNINGYGWGLKIKNNQITDKLCLFVTVKKKLPPHLVPADEFIPPVWEGIYTDVIEAGEFRFMCFRCRHRPVPCGVSADAWYSTAGTHCLYVFKNVVPYSLSCTHTYAGWGDKSIGEVVIQPAPEDGGDKEIDYFGIVESYIPLQYQPPGALAEGAIARVEPENVSFEVLELGGYVRELGACELGVGCYKVGRTTGLTKLKISSCNFQVVLQTGACFQDQILLYTPDCPMPSRPGDSGSPIIRIDNFKPVGMLIAASIKYVVASKLSNILPLLGVSL